MNKRELIDKIASEKDDRIMVSHLLDLDFRANEKGIVLSGDFLDLNRASVIADAGKYFSCDLHFYGGYDDAERKVIYFLPDGIDPVYSDLCLLTSAISAPLGHREVLGSLMSLGIDRKLVGDILISDGKVQIIAKKEISSYWVVFYLFNSLYNISMAYADARLIICPRSVPQLRSIAMVCVGVATAIHTVPIGFSAEPPVGPAMPVVAMA